MPSRKVPPIEKPYTEMANIRNQIIMSFLLVLMVRVILLNFLCAETYFKIFAHMRTQLIAMRFFSKSTVNVMFWMRLAFSVDEEAAKSPDCSWKVLVMRRKATAAKSSKLTMSMKFQKLLK